VATNVGTTTRAFLTASNADAEATLTTGFTLVNASPLSLGVRLGATTPLTKGADDATLLDYRKLGDGTKAELSIQGTIWRAPARPSKLIAWCDSVKKRVPDPIPNVQTCTQFKSADLDNAPRALYREFMATAKWSEPTVFELTSSAVRNNGKFLNETTFAPDSQDRVGYAVGGSVGRTFSGLAGLRAALLSVGYQYQVKYRQRDTAQVCVPAGPAGSLRCRSGPLGAPKQKLGNVINGELRGFISAKFGIAPQAAYLVRDDEWELGLPIYFAPDKDGILIGGLAPSYTTEGREWGVRLFVGASGFGFSR
jgi:hypothetical protein